MRSFFRIVLLALVLLVVALISALTAMRFAIHGREVNVPNLVDKTPAEARLTAGQAGLSMAVERQYYSSTTPAGRILSQLPTAGAKVRRGWEVQVAESLGAQRVQIPDVLGQSERAAEITIRRRGLEISSVAQVAVPGTEVDDVLSQDPLANASDVAAPKIGLLVSDAPQPQAFVMPSFVGQPLGKATAALQAAGLHTGKVSIATPSPPSNLDTLPSPPASPSVTTAPPSPAGVVVSQDPASGQKVLSGGLVNFVVR